MQVSSGVSFAVGSFLLHGEKNKQIFHGTWFRRGVPLSERLLGGRY